MDHDPHDPSRDTLAGRARDASLPKPATMTDVARAAGCSQATVSFVFSPDRAGQISPDTRRRVLEAAAALGYRHRRDTRNKRRRSTAPESPGQLHGRKEAGTTQSRSHRLADEIGRRIVAGHYAEGAVIPGDAELMREFSVSRTVLREAKKTLSGKALLAAKSRVGTRVRDRREWQIFDTDVLTWHAAVGFQPKFLAALGEMRLLVEPGAAALAAQRHAPGEVDELYRWIERMAKAGNSLNDFVHADLQLHLQVARIAGNPFLSALGTLIEVALVAALTKSSPVEEVGGAARSAAKHRRIVDAIAAGDAEAAREAMTAVIVEGIGRAAAEP